MDRRRSGKNLSNAQGEQARTVHELTKEPMIARVRTRDENGLERVYHFTRNFTLTVTPDLLDKFLYVGATRAATFLGLSCTGAPSQALAAAIEGLGGSWNP